MSKTRSTAKRELERSHDNINWSLEHIKSFLDLGYKDLPDFNDPIDPIIKALIMAQEVLKTLQSKI